MPKLRDQHTTTFSAFPVGASIDHIKDSYRLRAKKSPITDVAYQTLTDPKKRQKYDGWMVDRTNAEMQPQIEPTQGEQNWGSRGAEKDVPVASS